MKQLLHDDGSWAHLLEEWAKQCHDFDEDFSSYMPATIPLLGEQIEICSGERWNGVYAHVDAAGEHHAVCFVNRAFIPRFSGRVLRVRNLILAPKYDLGSYSADDYARLLASIFESVLALSDRDLVCPHVKIHFRSPVDLDLFRNFSEGMTKFGHFSDIQMVGSWLFVSKLLTDT